MLLMYTNCEVYLYLHIDKKLTQNCLGHLSFHPHCRFLSPIYQGLCLRLATFNLSCLNVIFTTVDHKFTAALEPPFLKLQSWCSSFCAMRMLFRGGIYLEHTWFIQKTLVKLQCSTVCCILQTEIDRVDDEMLFLPVWWSCVSACL